jgi:hypothetical protein
MNKVPKSTVIDYTDLVKTRLRDLGATVDFAPTSSSTSDPATAVNQVISHFQKFVLLFFDSSSRHLLTSSSNKDMERLVRMWSLLGSSIVLGINKHSFQRS